METSLVQKILDRAEQQNGEKGDACPKCGAMPAGGKHKRDGFFVRKNGNKRIQRFRCQNCKMRFSEATGTLDFGQHRRDVNLPVFQSLSSLVSLRRTAELTCVNRKTIARRLPYFEVVAKLVHAAFLDHLSSTGRLAQHVQFDDMETSEHTKLKPVTIPLLVSKNERFVLNLEVASMPAKGPMAALSRRKYGPRADDRPKAWAQVLSQSRRCIAPNATSTTDMHVSYPKPIREHLPGVTHIRCKGRKACVAGQGELKKGGRDPLFALNHTAAMFRANVNLLIRRTWCTTKRIDRLRCHLWLYVLRHNIKILEGIRKKEMANQKKSGKVLGPTFL
jgi:transposase-like protein